MQTRPMTQTDAQLMPPKPSRTASLQEHIDRATQDLIASCRDPERLSPEERRGIIARYSAVLEGNFIYWMTAAYLSVGSAEAHAIIQDNLLEEVRDNHPGMLRRIAHPADAAPPDPGSIGAQSVVLCRRHFPGRRPADELILPSALLLAIHTEVLS